jgi:hypothetical protein
VPRAKKTDRAEARRRSRIAAGTIDDQDIELEAPAADDERPVRRPDARPERPSITAAFRQSFHPLDLRDDLRTLPLLLRSRAVWLPLLLSVLAAALFVAMPTSLTFIVFQYFVFTLPLGAVFLAGFLAPRSSWLAGLVVGLGTVVVFAIALYSGRLDTIYAPETRTAYIAQSLVLSTIGGSFFAATAAWYRRFLRLSNPNRGRQQQPSRRGTDGRSRTNRSQAKPTARR